MSSSGDRNRANRPLSYVTTPRTWFDHEWLSEILLHLALVSAGSTGLVMAKTAVCLAMLGAVAWHLRRRGVPRVPTIAVVMLVCLVLSTGTIVFRTHLYTYALFLVTLVVVANIGKRGRPGS